MHTEDVDRSLQRQCAWCRKVADAHGAYSRPSREIVQGATYGICPGCKATLMAAADAALEPEPEAREQPQRLH